ncbi:Crp/Fnr family transcriptional regulator [Clostridium sp. HCP1S3_A12]|uniref:Crp/Fnr family transcriptional regulator n=1 Tax=unclassified Clostridium TaxID=2614128 RepID=UPI003F8863D8
MFHQGEKSNNFYFLESGATKIFSASKYGNEKTIFILRTKGIFAASSFFSGDIRRSSCIALENSEIIVIDKNLVNSIILEGPNFALNV